MPFRTNSILRILAVLAVIGLLASAAPVFAASAPPKKDAAATKTTAKPKPTDISGAVSQSYNADKTVQIGMIVQLKEKDSTTVLPLTSKNVKSMFGVVIPLTKAPIVLAPQTAKSQQVLVATSGRQNVLVSNQAGPIRVGDYVTVSAIDGLGMKASDQEEQVMGKAAGAFNGNANVIGSLKLKDTAGKESNVSLGRIAVDVDVTHNPLYSKTVDFVPAFLAGVALSLADKPVSVARIYLCTLLLVLTFFITGNMLYSGVRSGMIAVGRNPLSKKSIIKSLIQTVIAAMIIFAIGVFAVYLLLKL